MTVAHIVQPIVSELKQVRREIERQLTEIDSQALPRFSEITESGVHHLFAVHGKYLRPSLVLLGALALDEHRDDRRKLVKVATALELVHSASLVHDDIIDEAETRRNRPSLNSVFGNKFAVLVGDLLYAQAFSLLTSLTGLDSQRRQYLYRLFTDTTKKMCLGELYEDEILAAEGDVGYEDYLKVIDYKTASLMSCCCETSAIVTSIPEELHQAITEYGYHLGMSYQLIDDVGDRDSVFYDRSIMIEKAVEEASAATGKLEKLPDGRYRERLAELARFVVRMANERIRV